MTMGEGENEHRQIRLRTKVDGPQVTSKSRLKTKQIASSLGSLPFPTSVCFSFSPYLCREVRGILDTGG